MGPRALRGSRRTSALPWLGAVHLVGGALNVLLGLSWAARWNLLCGLAQVVLAAVILVAVLRDRRPSAPRDHVRSDAVRPRLHRGPDRRAVGGLITCLVVASLACAPTPVASADPPVSVAGLLLQYYDLSRQAESLNEQLLAAEAVHTAQQADASAKSGAVSTASAEFDGERARYAWSLADSTRTLVVGLLPEADTAQPTGGGPAEELASSHSGFADAWSALLLARQQATAATGAAATSGADLQRRRDDLAGRITAVRAALDRLTPDQRDLLHGGSTARPEVAIPNGKAGAALEFALAQLGKPYEWGAEGPDSYDCSGLVQTAYATVGVPLPRVAVDQSRVGTAVSRSQVAAGDLIFFYSPVAHVAMAIDNQRAVQAATFGEPVKISAIDRIGPITAMRRMTG
ncbi:C40 family peptidase [Umezawaea sp. Da 62-37]|uniref:C40 family peptidase n=1 Tax=Umezawaea sp. Da 62-37 TaxID=3075927 RepID=UPI0028F6E828|nr:C40 family peptidase [Umezawaea sp. Da 62-37]WNV87960.1 C40 family peptidase [Umezawaea sp. Da 62-37]